MPVSAADRRAQQNALLDLDPARTAIVTVDMQRAYLDPIEGSNPLAPADLRRVLAATTELLRRVRELGVPVVHCYVARRVQEAERGFQKSPYAEIGRRHGAVQNPRNRQGVGWDRLEGTTDAALAPELPSGGDCHVTTKKTMDSFYGTDLEILLSRALRIDAIVLTGVNTDTCVYSTAFSASNRGYRTVVAADCVGSMRGDGPNQRALQLMANSFAWVMSSEEILGKLARVRPSPTGDSSAMSTQLTRGTGAHSLKSATPPPLAGHGRP